MLYMLRALPDCATETVLLHRNRKDLSMTGRDLVSHRHIGDHLLSRRDHALMEARPSIESVGARHSDMSVPVIKPSKMLQQAGVRWHHFRLRPRALRGNFAMLVVPNAAPNHDVTQPDFLGISRGRDSDQDSDLWLPVEEYILGQSSGFDLSHIDWLCYGNLVARAAIYWEDLYEVNSAGTPTSA
jgi:hypothetical protein